MHISHKTINLAYNFVRCLAYSLGLVLSERGLMERHIFFEKQKERAWSIGYA